MKMELVHNDFEARALIKEAFRNGDEAKYDGCEFRSHDGKFLFTCKISLTEFEMDRSHDGEVKDSTIVEIA